MRDRGVIAVEDATVESITRALESLHSGGVVRFSGEMGRTLAADLFHESARSSLERATESATGVDRVIMLANVEHIDSMASNLSPDARIVIRRMLPGPLSLLVNPSPLVPSDALTESGMAILSVPRDPIATRLLTELGHPLLALVEAESGRGGTVLDVSIRPARIVREGVPGRAELERVILLEEKEA